MPPAKLATEAVGTDNPERIAWQTGLMACFGSELIECGGPFIADKPRHNPPPHFLAPCRSVSKTRNLDRRRFCLGAGLYFYRDDSRRDDRGHYRTAIFQSVPLDDRGNGIIGVGIDPFYRWTASDTALAR